MKFALAIACLTLAVCAQVQAGPPPVPEENLSPQCRTPKCPLRRNANLPYPMDCLLYVKCDRGVATVAACPPDMHFNAAVGRCTDRDTANCVNCWQRPVY